MLPDEKARYIANHPEVMAMPLPDGWRRLDSMPLSHKVEFLTEDGATYAGGASNAAFIVAADKVVAWRPLSLEAALDMELRPAVRARLAPDVLAAELARLTAKYERLG